MKSIIVRNATVADTETIVEFNRLLAWESEAKTLDVAVLTRGVRACLLDPHKGTYYLATTGDRVIGQLLITTEWSDWRDGWFWWIQSVYVDANHRRSGVFRTLADAVETAAVAAGNVVGVRLYVEDANTAAQATYRAIGMVDENYRVLVRLR